MNILSDRINALSESQTISMAKMGRELAAKGYDVINLSFGEPDFPTPEPVKMAAHRAIDANFTKYTPNAGIPDLRRALVEERLRRKLAVKS